MFLLQNKHVITFKIIILIVINILFNELIVHLHTYHRKMRERERIVKCQTNKTKLHQTSERSVQIWEMKAAL